MAIFEKIWLIFENQISVTPLAWLWAGPRKSDLNWVEGREERNLSSLSAAVSLHIQKTTIGTLIEFLICKILNEFWFSLIKYDTTQWFYSKTYSIVKDSSADLGVNSKIVQNRPTLKAVSTKSSKLFFCIFVNILILLR